MDSTTSHIVHDFTPYFRIYKDGHIERLGAPQFAPPSDDPTTAVRSKDITISPETGLSVRLYLPTTTATTTQKLPLLFYIHGGAFCVGSASSPTFHNYINSLVSESNVVAVSVDYRLAPENLLPVAYDDSWTAFQWLVSQANGKCHEPEPWLIDHADLQRVFLLGESAGANICNDVAIRAGVSELYGLEIVGLLLVHPYFGGKEEDKLYKFLCPTSSGLDDDPRLNPAVDERLSSMRCKRVLFCLAEKDSLRDVGLGYHEVLKKSGWSGVVEIMESEGEGHGFHLLNPTCEKTAELKTRLASFLNE